MSSMYFHHKYGLHSDCFIISSFSSAINKILYGGANLVLIAVPRLDMDIDMGLSVDKNYIRIE